MVSRFYQSRSKLLLIAVLLSFPVLTHLADSLPTNNDVETWLPNDSDVRRDYNAFKREFGAEEVILIGLDRSAQDAQLLEALAQRLEKLSQVRQCLSPGRLRSVMRGLSVDDKQIDERLEGFLLSKNTDLIGMVALLSDAGLKDRVTTARAIRAELDYCQLRDDDIYLAGAPVVVAELDRLGNRESNKKFFLITLFVSLCLLYYTVRQWKPVLAILGLIVWAINLTMATVNLAGGEMNFILGALSVMVMVFTMAIAIHVLHYYRSSLGSPDPLGRALKLAWKPCFLATLTTTIGLMSLTVSDIAPVRQFGYAASAGSIVALLTGLGLTPAVIALWPVRNLRSESESHKSSQIVSWILGRSRVVAAAAMLLVAVTSVGLFFIESKVDPLDFLPRAGKVLSDIRRIEHDLTNTSSVEAVLDFGDSDLAFVEKLDEVRRIESRIAEHPAVRHTMSVATFFPDPMPQSTFEATALLKKANARRGNSGFIADGDRRWRISARVSTALGHTRMQAFNEIGESLRGEPVTLTGVSPLLEGAQTAIFDGFWESFTAAFGIITAVMVLSLRSLRLGLVAMIPNLTPICIVFGTLGWLGVTVDIGMMMTASIALGIAVDGTFHFLVRYNEQHRQTGDSAASSHTALVQTGSPIFQAAAIASLGMLAMTLSSFTPMARFGMMMSSLLLAALVGDLVLLPALLALRPQKSDDYEDGRPAEDGIDRRQGANQPHFQLRINDGSQVKAWK